MLTKERTMKTSEVYTAYAELERAAEAFYTAADKLGQLVPSLKQQLNTASEELNFAVIAADTELDEVI
jgi:hypothetical protein